MLIDFYNATSTSKKFEIVYISSDKTVEDFESYVSSLKENKKMHLVCG